MNRLQRLLRNPGCSEDKKLDGSTFLLHEIGYILLVIKIMLILFLSSKYRATNSSRLYSWGVGREFRHIQRTDLLSALLQRNKMHFHLKCRKISNTSAITD